MLSWSGMMQDKYIVRPQLGLQTSRTGGLPNSRTRKGKNGDI